MYLGIDLGGTHCRIAATDNLQTLNKITKKEFLLTHDFEKDFARIVTIIHELSPAEIKAIGIGTPGSFDKEKTMITSNANNISEWINKPIKQLLDNVFHCPISLENDGVTAALGEAYFGGKKHEEFAYIIWGTGIGGAKVIRKNNKAEVEKLDWYQYLESWENSCGGNTIKKKFGKPAELLSETEWKRVMKQFSKELNSFSQKTQTPLIIFGGGIAVKQAKRLKNISDTEIQISTLGDNAGLYGALSLLK